MRCPVCGSRNVTKLKTGSYKCNDCGFVFYPDRDAIIDLRDLVEGGDLTAEEKEVIGERIKEASTELSRSLYGAELLNVFDKNSNLDEIAAKYSGEEYLYGVFIDFTGEIEGTLLLIIPEKNIEDIVSKYSGGVIDSLKKLSLDSFNAFVKKLSWNASAKNVDIAYDTMNALVSYLTSEIGKDKELLILNYQFILGSRRYGELLFLPSKNSIKLLRRFL